MPPRKRKDETVEQLNARIRDEVTANLETIPQRVVAGQDDAVAELREETETLIGRLPAEERTDLRAKLKDAATPVAELVSPEEADRTALEAFDGVLDLVDESAAAIAEGIKIHQRGVSAAVSIAEQRLQMRLLIRHNGEPDLRGDSYPAKLAAKMSAERALEILQPEVSDRDELEAAAETLQRSVQNAMGDVRTLFLRSLDDPKNGNQREIFAEILAADETGRPASEVVAEHYSIASLKTNAEKKREARQLAARIKEARESGDHEALNELLEPAEVIKSAMSDITRGVKHITPGVLQGADSATKQRVRDEIAATIEALRKLVADAT